jgi:hypothetical protein
LIIIKIVKLQGLEFRDETKTNKKSGNRW